MVRPEWRLLAAALVVLLGIYFGLGALWVSGSAIEAGLLCFAGLSSGATLLLTPSWGDLFDPDATRLAAGAVFILTVIGIFLNAPLTDDCRQKAYPDLIDSVTPDRLAARGPELTVEDQRLTETIIRACSLAPNHDAADLASEIGQAGSDYVIASHADVDPGFLRRLVTWHSTAPESPCLTAYRSLKGRHPDLFSSHAAGLACLDQRRARIHL